MISFLLRAYKGPLPVTGQTGENQLSCCKQVFLNLYLKKSNKAGVGGRGWGGGGSEGWRQGVGRERGVLFLSKHTEG